ncbi:MAG: hypothetical protein D3923_16395, partial [Candidatus Electrothrix sp. AR3]|nr:hypothetical protein [Candidatus Electrothrix sp. AR3]
MDVQNSSTKMLLPTASDLKNELALVDPHALTVADGAEKELEESAEAFVNAVLACDPNAPEQQNARDANISAVENLGGKTK